MIKENLNIKKNEALANNKEESKIKNSFFKFLGSYKLIIIIAVAVMFILGAFIFFHKYNEKKEYNLMVQSVINVDNFYEGIYIQGINVSGKTKDEAKEMLSLAKDNFKDNINIEILCDDDKFNFTQDNIHYIYYIDEAVNNAYNFARNGSNNDRYEQVTKLKEEPQNFPLTYEIDFNSGDIENFVDNVYDKTYIAMKSPFISEFNPNSNNMFVKHEGIKGREIDKADLTKQLTDKLLNKEYIFSINCVVNEIPVTGSIDDLDEQTKLISEFSTVSTNNANGNTNMSLAMNAVNGIIVEPGEYFSFNSSTGDTNSPVNGYLPAGAISNGKLVQEYGGGICQAATTIYGAALRADMTITTRYNHLWPSTYVPIGQDATVDYPSTDFRFRNDSKYPVFIEAYMSGNTLTAKIYGYQPQEWDSIEVVSEKTETISPPEPRYIEDSSLAVGQEVVEKSSSYGYRASGSKIYYKNGDMIKTEAIDSSYYSECGAVIRVGTAG